VSHWSHPSLILSALVGDSITAVTSTTILEDEDDDENEDENVRYRI
jgi:hypothetical protein